MEQRPYYEQTDIENTQKLRKLLSSLPPFCGTFFRGIEQETSSRTRIAYAYDLRVFFEFLLKENPVYKNKEIKDITLSDLDRIKALDLEEYIAVKDRMLEDYRDRAKWKRMMLTNIAKAGYFSSDRTIREYNEEIWKLS